MTDGSAIQKIEELVRGSTVQKLDDGRTVIGNNLIVLRDKDDFDIKPLTFSTLAGLIEFLKIYDLNECNYFLHVEHNRVRAIMKKLQFGKRQIFVEAVFNLNNGFEFSNYYDTDSFIVKLNTSFSQTEDRASVVRYVSKLTSENSISTTDDGITQTATIKKGVSGALKEQSSFSPFVQLSPVRTFLDIKQPISTFLFRMKQGHGNETKCALFEVENDAWKLRVIENIKVFLKNNLPQNMAVIG